MKVLLYARETAETENRLQRFLESHLPWSKMEVFRTIEGLGERLKAPHGGEMVAVLQANTQEDLAALLSIHHRLQGIKTILLAPDREEETIARAHQLRPRFLGYTHNDLHGVAAVLEKMLKGNG